MPKKNRWTTMLAEYRNSTGTYVGVKIATTDAASYFAFAMSIGSDDSRSYGQHDRLRTHLNEPIKPGVVTLWPK